MSVEQKGTKQLKCGFAQMTKGGVIMDVTNYEQAKIAENAGACAVMALDRIPADIRKDGGVARMADPKVITRYLNYFVYEVIKDVQRAVSIPVMAKARIGHFAEAQILQALKVDMIDESEVLTPADMEHHICKKDFHVPFVCGARDLGEALRRIDEGATMIRTKGEAGTGNVTQAVSHARQIQKEIKRAQLMSSEEKIQYAHSIRVPVELLNETCELGRLTVVNFAAGGLSTPADVSLLMQLGVDGVFVGSGIFKSDQPVKRAAAIVRAVTHYKDAELLAEVSEGLGQPMVGINCDEMIQKWSLRESYENNKSNN